jgi:hypothetical protein
MPSYTILKLIFDLTMESTNDEERMINHGTNSEILSPGGNWSGAEVDVARGPKMVVSPPHLTQSEMPKMIIATDIPMESVAGAND